MQGFSHQALIFVHQVSRRDRHDVAGEGKQPAGEGIGAAHAEAAVLGMSLDHLAQPEGGRRGRAGPGAKRDRRDHRVAGPELPRLPGTRVLPQVEPARDLVVRSARASCAFTSASVMRLSR